jgi:hypothetical protein
MGIDESVRDTSASEELAIRRTLACYCHYIDDGRFADLVDLFAPDGSFVLGTIAATGRGELLGLFEERQGGPEQRGRHLTLNTVIDLVGTTARARSDFVFLKLVDGRPTPVGAGRYHDDLVQIDGQWRFACRRVDLWVPPED